MAINVGQLEIKLFADLARLQSDMNKANRTIDTAMRKVQSSVSLARNALGGLTAGVVIASITKYADQVTKLSGLLKNATLNQVEYNQAFNNVRAIATKAQTDLESVAKVYSRLSNAMRDMGASQNDISSVVETLSLALKVNGATAEETASVLLQLSQAFGSGRLQGDEFRSVMEGAPNVMRELAKSMGVPIGALKDLAKEGKITSEVMLNAFKNPDLLASLSVQAKEMRTVKGSLTELGNEFGLFIGNVAEKTGIVDVFKIAIDGTAQAIRSMNDALITGKLRVEAFLPAYEAYREKVLGESRKIWSPQGGVGSAISADEFKNLKNVSGSSIIIQTEEEAKAAKEAADAIRKEQVKLAEEAKKRAIEANEFEVNLAMTWFKLKEKEREKETEEEKKQAEELYETRMKYIEMEQAIANRNFEEAQRKAEQATRTADSWGGGIAQSLTDALLRGFERGESFAKNFRTTLINMFKSLTLQPVIRFLIDSSGLTAIMGALSGAFSTSANAGSLTGGGGFGGLFGDIQNVFSNLNNSFQSSIEQFGAYIADYFPDLGGAIGQYSGLISQGLPYAGALLQLASGNIAGGAGTAIGALVGGPVGGAIGGLIGNVVGGMFGGESYDRYGSQVIGVRRAGGSYVTTSTGIVYDKDAGAKGQLEQLNKAFTDTLGGFLEKFGVLTDIWVGSDVFIRRDSSGSNFTFNVGQGNKNNKFEIDGTDLRNVWNQLTGKVFGSYMVQALMQSALPDNLKKFFEGLSKQADVTATMNGLVALTEQLKYLPPVFDAIRNAIGTTGYKKTIAELDATAQATKNYTDLFYTEQENFNTYTKQLQGQFSALNQVLPSSRDAFRALVDGINVTDESSFDLFNSLVSLAPAMDTYYKYLEQQASAINEVNQALADGLDSRLYSTYADYASAQANALATGNTTAFLAKYNNPSNDALLEEIKMLRQENADMKIYMQKIVDYTRETALIQKQWNGDGLPDVRTY